MLNKQFFQKLKEEYLDYGKERHEIIKHSSDALRLSKQAIFALHRDDMKMAKEMISQVENIYLNLAKKFKDKVKLQYEGAYSASVEEYVEAKLLLSFLETQKIPAIKEVKVNLESYVGGLCDFTGELVRRAVKLVSQQKYDEIKMYADATDQIISELIKFDLTKMLRVKYDQAIRNLRKLEEILYDISLQNK